MTTPCYDQSGIMLYLGNCLEVMRDLGPEIIDAVVTDPPSAMGFMSKSWDTFQGCGHFVTWLTEIMVEAKRLLKPGGHILTWAIPRTAHWTATAIEDAGFEIRDVLHNFYDATRDWENLLESLAPEQRSALEICLANQDASFQPLYHLFGTGWPKGLNISKALDDRAGAERYVVGRAISPDGRTFGADDRPLCDTKLVTAPATDLAQRYEGFFTQLKPACEHWILARKTCQGSVVENVERFGTGGINAGACRIGTTKDGDPLRFVGCKKFQGTTFASDDHSLGMQSGEIDSTTGRYPSNTILTHSAACRRVGTKRVKPTRLPGGEPPTRKDESGYRFQHHDRNGISFVGHDGLEEVDAWECVPECPVAILDSQSGVLSAGGFPKRRFSPKTKSTYGTFEESECPPGLRGSEGTASRYFYNAKESSAEKWFYCRDCQRAYPVACRDQHGHGHQNAKGRQTWDHVV